MELTAIIEHIINHAANHTLTPEIAAEISIEFLVFVPLVVCHLIKYMLLTALGSILQLFCAFGLFLESCVIPFLLVFLVMWPFMPKGMPEFLISTAVTLVCSFISRCVTLFNALDSPHGETETPLILKTKNDTK
jgi:hypothetical protein